MILHSQIHKSSRDAEPLFAHPWNGISLKCMETNSSRINADLYRHHDRSSRSWRDPHGLFTTHGSAILSTGSNCHDAVTWFQPFSCSRQLPRWVDCAGNGCHEPAAIASVMGLAPAGLWLAPFNARYPGGAIARMLANSLNVVSPTLLHYEWARKIGFENVSPRWREFSYDLCLEATDAMAAATGYYPAWDALLKKRFDAVIDESIPITVIFGDTDKTLPATTCQERSLVPSHTVWLVFSECGHAPMWDHPQEVIAEILRTTGHSKGAHRTLR